VNILSKKMNPLSHYCHTLVEALFMEASTDGINIQSLQSGDDGCKLQDQTATFCAPFPPRYFTSKRHTIHDNLCVNEKPLSYQLPYAPCHKICPFIPLFSFILPTTTLFSLIFTFTSILVFLMFCFSIYLWPHSPFVEPLPLFPV
jgi:hypothetical protein